MTFDMYFSRTFLSLVLHAGSSHNASIRAKALRYASHKLPKLALFLCRLSLRTEISANTSKGNTAQHTTQVFCLLLLVHSEPAKEMFGLSISSKSKCMAPGKFVGRWSLKMLGIFATTSFDKIFASDPKKFS